MVILTNSILRVDSEFGQFFYTRRNPDSLLALVRIAISEAIALRKVDPLATFCAQFFVKN